MPLISTLGTPNSLLGFTQVLGNPNVPTSVTPPACPTAGWGRAPWGTFPWGGTTPIVVGGTMPTQSPFDIYCIGPCGEISVIFSFPAVQATPSADFLIDGVTGDAVITSVDGSEAHLYVDLGTNADWTLEFIINGAHLPAGFSDIANHHLFVGVTDQAASTAGLFFSEVGVAYAGTIDSAVTPLPNSQSFFSEGEYYIILLACSTSTGATYVYITPLSQFESIGHQLRYILPTIPYTSTPQTQVSGTHIYAKGDAAEPTQVFLDELCLGNGALIPNLPPVADAGPDQAVAFCEIVRLDGSASFDPEGAPITYYWRLIDAPTGSMFAFTGTDGTTIPQPLPTGFTNKFYSTSFIPPSPAIPVSPGDVLLVGGKPYTCIFTGTDINGAYVQINGNDLPDDLTDVAYTILKQNGISGANTATPTFYPDVPGFYRFDLTVMDASLVSDPSAVVVVNVITSALPRGIIPDLSFIWNYLSDFWKLIEDPERIGTIWSSLAQVMATELYTLWQIDYSKSLKDIQRTLVRRWLHYDLLLREPFIEITANRFIFGPVDSTTIPNTGANVVGETITFTSAFLGIPSITFTGINPLTPAQIAAQIAAVLTVVDPRFVVTVNFQDSTHSKIRIYAPFSFTIASSPIFSSDASNGPLAGTSGVLLNPQTYQVEISLNGLDVEQNDNLVVYVRPPLKTPFWQSVRIASVLDAAADLLRFQRLVLQDPLPLYATSSWAIPSKALSTQLDFWDGLVDTGDIALYEVTDSMEGTTTFYQAIITAATSTQTNTVLLNASGIADFLQLPTRFRVFFWGVYRQHYMPIEPLIVDIPTLQRVINTPNESEVLRRNLDFFMDTYRGEACIRFNPNIWIVTEGVGTPIPRLWAEYNYIDNRPTVEANFGLAVDFTLEDLSELPSTVDYLSAVQGLWYAYLHGPTLFDIRVGTQILLGLPFAEVEGTITEIRTDFSPNTGRILIQDIANTTIVRSYEYPQSLSMEVNPVTGVPYVVGDVVQQFAPLITGVVVTDWVKDPNWFQGYLEQGAFFEVQKFFTFFVSVSSAVFNLPALLFVKQFLLQIKPTYTYPLFVIKSVVGEADITVTDEVTFKVFLSLYVGAVYALKQTTIADSPDPGPGTLVGGVPTQWSGLLSSIYVDAADTNTDADYPGNTFPSYSTPDPLIVAGSDKPFLSPGQFATAFASMAYAGGTPSPDGTIFRTSFPAYTGAQYGLGAKYVTDLLHTATIAIGSPVTVTGNETLNCCEIFVEGTYDPTQNTNYALEIYKNGVLSQTLDFSYTSTTRSTFLFTTYLATFTSISVVTNDILSIKLKSTGSANVRILWNNFFVSLGNGVALGALPADTYTRLAAL